MCTWLVNLSAGRIQLACRDVQPRCGNHSRYVQCMAKTHFHEGDEMGLGTIARTVLHLILKGKLCSLFLCCYGYSSRRFEDRTVRSDNGVCIFVHCWTVVVAPLSVVQNWSDELSNFAPSLKTVCYQPELLTVLVLCKAIQSFIHNYFIVLMLPWCCYLLCFVSVQFLLFMLHSLCILVISKHDSHCERQLLLISWNNHLKLGYPHMHSNNSLIWPTLERSSTILRCVVDIVWHANTWWWISPQV